MKNSEDMIAVLLIVSLLSGCYKANFEKMDRAKGYCQGHQAIAQFDDLTGSYKCVDAAFNRYDIPNEVIGK